MGGSRKHSFLSLLVYHKGWQATLRWPEKDLWQKNTDVLIRMGEGCDQGHESLWIHVLLLIRAVTQTSFNFSDPYLSFTLRKQCHHAYPTGLGWELSQVMLWKHSANYKGQLNHKLMGMGGSPPVPRTPGETGKCAGLVSPCFMIEQQRGGSFNSQDSAHLSA